MRWVVAVFVVAGLLMAGSDGSLFPWPNVAGAVLLGAAAWLADRQYYRRYSR